MKNIELKVGDTYTNTKGNVIKIEKIFSSGSKCTTSSNNWGSKYNRDTFEIINNIKSGIYTNYKPVSLKYDELIKGELYYFQTKCGLFAIGNFNQIGYISVTRKEWFNITCNINNNDYHYLIRYCTKEEKEWFNYCKQNQKYISFDEFKKSVLAYTLTPDECIDPYDTSKFKVGDLVTFESSNRYSCSNDFKGKITYKTNYYIAIEVLEGFFKDKLHPKNDYKRIKGYKTSPMIFHHCKFKLITNINNKNEKSRIVETEQRRERRATAISYNPTRTIASSSRLVGNSAKGRSIKTQIGTFEISRRVIAA
jgi:hypothetical protein